MEAFFPNIFSILVALCISAVFTFSIIDLAKKRNLFESNSSLKLHTEQVCSLGGISIFSAFWIALCLFGQGLTEPSTAYLFVGSFLLFLTGVKDDLVGLPPLRRLGIQVSVAALLFFGGVQLTHLPGLSNALPPFVSFSLTILLIGAVVNAFNFIDGVNGLSGGLAVIAALAFSVLFYLAGAYEFSLMALSLSGAVAGFLIFNFGKAKVFMGDNGSTFIGIMLSFLLIVFLRPEVQATAVEFVSPGIVAALLFVPMLDMVKVVIGRMARGKSPFRGDLTHIHHLLRVKGFSAPQICCALYTWNILVVVLSFYLLPQNIYISILCILIVGTTPYIMLNFFSDKAEERRQVSTMKRTKLRELT